MKRLFVLFVLCVFALTNIACTQAESKTEPSNDEAKLSEKIEVYYFHFSRRCITCNAVEDVTKNTIKEYFSAKVKSGNITFKSVNLDEDSGKKIAENLGISGQTLLFVSGEKKVNLTNEAFMYAKNQPDKLKAKVKETIDGLL